MAGTSKQKGSKQMALTAMWPSTSSAGSTSSNVGVPERGKIDRELKTKRRHDEEVTDLVRPAQRVKMQNGSGVDVSDAKTTETGPASSGAKATWAPSSFLRAATSSCLDDDIIEGAPLEGLDAGEYSKAKQELMTAVTTYWRYGVHSLEPPDGLLDTIARKFDTCVGLLEAKREEEKEKNEKMKAVKTVKGKGRGT